MISGKLPNDSVWWLSTDNKKIWIESENIEQEKFKEKKYIINHGRIFYDRKEVGELTGSRLESRKRKYSWVIKLEAMADVYPGLIEEINMKENEEKKKKRVNGSRSKKGIKKGIKPGIVKEMPKKEIGEIDKDVVETSTETDKKKDIEIIETKKVKEPVKVYFDKDMPYVTMIKDEVDKSEDGKFIISLKDLKTKMGEEYEKMDDFRIYYGLNKILSNIDITMELNRLKKESMAILKKLNRR